MAKTKRVRRTALMEAAGPYKAESQPYGYCVRVYPAWPEYTVEPDGGGGPGVITRLQIAADIQRFLNGRDVSDLEYRERESAQLRIERLRLRRKEKAAR